MHKILWAVTAILAFGVLGAAEEAGAFTITQASTQTLPDGFPVTACADVGGAKTANGTPVGPFPCNNNLNEEWILSFGQFQGLGSLGTTLTANNCMYVEGVNAGGGVAIYPCETISYEAWQLQTSGEFVNIGLVSSFCLDSQGKIGGGLQLVVNACSGTAGQLWQLNGVTITQTSNQNVQNGFPITACVDVNGGDTANGAPVGPFPCNNGFNERWTYAGGQFIGLGSFNGTKKCLSVHGNSTAAGAPVELDTCAQGSKGQLWKISQVSQIISSAGNNCLDSQGQIGGNLQLVVNPCNDTDGQFWDLR
jgi:hypothetical protein